MRVFLNDLIFGVIVIGYLVATMIYLVVTHERKKQRELDPIQVTPHTSPGSSPKMASA
jgi:mannose/fructose/N-acetylgalactosamine-specific phosphotransferase system component IID